MYRNIMEDLIMGINGIAINNDSAYVKPESKSLPASSCMSSDIQDSTEIGQDEYNQENIERKKEELRTEISLLSEQFDATCKELKKKELKKKLMYCSKKIEFNPTFSGILGLLLGSSVIGTVGSYISTKLVNICPNLPDGRADIIVGAVTILSSIAGGILANKLESDGYIHFRRGTEIAEPVFELVDKGPEYNNKRYNRAKEFEESEIRPLEQKRDELLNLIIQKTQELESLGN